MEYAFTVKYLGKENVEKVPSDYETVWSHWAKFNCNIVEKEFEPDSRGVCHCHGIVIIPKDFYRIKLHIYGINMRFDPITDRSGWMKYIKKYQNKEKMKIVHTSTCSAQRPERSERPVREDPWIPRSIAPRGWIDDPLGYRESVPKTLPKLVNNLQGYRKSVPSDEKLFSLLILF